MSKKRLITLLLSIVLTFSVISPYMAAADTEEHETYEVGGETWKYGLGDASGFNENTYKTVSTNGNNNWREGSVTGNGEIAFIESCDPNEDVFILNNTKIVSDSDHIFESPDIGGRIDEIKTAAVLGTSNPWLDIIDEYSQEKFGTSWGTSWPRPYQNAAQYRIINNSYTSENSQIYNRYTNFETGEVGVQWKNADRTSEWNRRSFASRSDNIIVTLIEADENLDITLSIDAMNQWQGNVPSGFTADYILDSDSDGYSMGMIGKYPVANRKGNKNPEERKFARGGWGTATRIIADGAEFLEGSNGGRPTLTITGTKSIMLITKVDRQDTGCDDLDDVKALLYNRMLGDIDDIVSDYKAEDKFTYEDLLAPHVAIHGEMFNNVRLDLCTTEEEKADRKLTNSQLISKQNSQDDFNKAYMERAYNTGRFALLCSSGYHGPRLGGIWNGSWDPQWSGDFTMNANVNLQVSSMNSGNMEEVNYGYIYLMLRQLPGWANNAKNIYGAEDAILAAPRADGTGYPGDGESYHFLGGYPQLFVNGLTDWMILPIFEYWLCYGNRQVPVGKDMPLQQIKNVFDLTNADINRINATGYFDLEKDILFPFLDKNMNFWMQYADEKYYMDGDGEYHVNDGTTLSQAIAAGDTNAKYIFTPTFSPENAPSGHDQIAFNSAKDISAAKNSVHMAKTVLSAVYPYKTAKLAQWEDFESKIPEYVYDTDGALKEWADPDLRENNSHRHTSHAYAAWPSHESQWNPELQAGLRVAVDNRYAYNATAPESHAHDHRALIEARLGNPEGLRRPLMYITKTNYRYSTFMTSHNHNLGSSYCTDMACSYTGIIDEMLLYSYIGRVKILPALINDVNKGSITGLRAKVGALVDEIAWDLDASTANVKLTSLKDNNNFKLECGVGWSKASINGVPQDIKVDELGNWYIDVTLDENETVVVNFELADTTLSNLKVNGVELSDFDPNVLDYNLQISESNQLPHVTAQAADPSATVTITQPSSIGEPAKVAVTNGSGKTDYVINFILRKNDGFNAETLDSKWQWVREDSSSWSLSSNPGFMTISPREGTIQERTNNAKNLLIQDAPGDWIVESKLVFSKKPDTDNQQGGIIAYDNDNSYVRVAWDNSNNGRLVMYRETGSSWWPRMDVVDTLPNVNDIIGDDNTVWFRMQKNGDTYTTYYSFDGIDFTLLGSTTAALNNVRVGLAAFNGNGTSTDLDVLYDYFNFVGEFVYEPIVDEVAVSLTSDTIKRTETMQALTQVKLEDSDELIDISALNEMIPGVEAEVEYFSLNPSIASVDENGVVTGNRPGRTEVQAAVTYNDITEISEPVAITVEPLEMDEVPVSLYFPKDIIEINEQADAVIKVEDAVDLYAANFKLSYDPELFVVEGVVADQGLGEDITLIYTNENGLINIVLTLLGDREAINGDADLIHITFKARDIDAATDVIVLEDSSFANSHGDWTDLGEAVTERIAIANSDITGGGTAINDLVLVAKAFGYTEGDPGYDPALDMNKDGVIDIIDIAYVSHKVLNK